MMDTVRDDAYVGARAIGRGRCRSGGTRWVGAIGLIGAVAWSGPLFTQPGGHGVAMAGGLNVTVREMPASAQRIVVPLNASVILETSAPVDRVQVAESAIAKVEPISAKQYILTGVGYGTTRLMLWTNGGEREMVEVHVELDVKLLNEKLREIDPQSDAQANSIMGNLLLTGTVSGAEVALKMEQFAALFLPPGTEADDSIQNHLRVSGQQQVLLRCTVAEVARSAMRRLGINGFLAGDDFRDVFAVNQIGGINPINIGAAGSVDVTNTIPFLTGAEGIPLSPAATLSLGFPRVQMQLFLDALRENALLKILAEPDLIAISGETATFLAGGEFPIPVPQSGAATGAVTIEYREFGVRVNFTPTVLAHQRIRLRVAPEVSETDFSTAVQLQGFIVPGLTQRRMETTVEAGNGQTLAIAGLLSEEVRGIAQAVPGLGEVPVLGALFRSIEYRRRETELVVLVTPELIAPVNPNQVPKVPGEDYLTPNDYELYALGLLEGQEEVDNSVGNREAFQTIVGPRVAPLESEPEELSLHGPWGYSEVGGL